MKHLSVVLLAFCSVLRIQAQQSDKLVIATIPHPLFWENSPIQFAIKENTLAITAGEKTDLFRDPNGIDHTDNVPALLFKPDYNFILSASIEHGFVNKWDGGAILLKNDSLNWIKFCFEKDYTGARRVVSVVTKGISDDCNSVELKTNKVFYKVAKAGQVITLYYSEDGLKWFLVRHLQFAATREFRVGFQAQSPTGTRCEVKFSDIKYEARKIADPYVGN